MPSPGSKDKYFNVEAYLRSMAPSDAIDFFGIEIPVPTDTPLSYTLKAQEIQESSAEDPRNVLNLLADFLGQEIADAIEERDPGIRALGVLLLWAGKNASGDTTSFEDAFAEYLDNERTALAEAKKGGGDAEEAETGKPQLQSVPSPNRAQRRASSGTRTGPKSAKTSR